MSSHRSARTHRRPRFSPRILNLLRLEDRLAPAISIMGPHSVEQLAILESTGANVWSPLVQLPKPPTGAISYYNLADAWYFQLADQRLNNRLDLAPFEQSPNYSKSFTLSLPRPDGTFQRFNVWEYSMMEPVLAAQFSSFHTYYGQGIDDPYAILAADVTAGGFHAQVLSPNGAFYIEPYYHLNTSVYTAYYKANNFQPPSFHCDFSEDLQSAKSANLSVGCGCKSGSSGTTQQSSSGSGGFTVLNSSNGATLRAYRTAVAATGEYTAFHGGTVLMGQGAVVTAINRVNQVYESELSIRLILVGNNSSIIYTDAGTDPYDNGNGSTMLGQNQSTCDTVIGSANYDLGHVFSTGGGGVAYLGVVGQNGNKARGVTGQASPIGDSFWIDYVAHEMGHQYGGNHTFNGTTGNCGGNRNGSTAYEQGSGSTIMAYAGICGTDNLQANSDPVFNWKSLDEISSYISSGAGVGNTQTATGNNLPVVNAGSNYTIPANTPFALTGSATDADGDPLTYFWEEADLGPATTITAPDNGSSPLFRSFTPTTSPTRTFPRLSNLLAGTNSVGEVMPTTNRTLNFRLTVFDNKVDGAFVTQPMKLTTVNTGASFAITAPNTAVTWTGGTQQSITWNVAGTTANGINVANVNILLSTDGGNSFPTVLASNTANDGSENIIVPNSPTSSARIKIQPVGNVFFDISDKNFTIAAGGPFQVSSSNPAALSTTTSPFTQFDVTFTTNVKVSTIGTDDLTLTQGNVTNAELLTPQSVRYTLANLPTEGAVTITVGTNALTDDSGNGNGLYAAAVNIDIGTLAFPSQLLPVAPLGSLAYTGSFSANIGASSDSDSFTINLEAGQKLSATVTPDNNLRPAVTINGPGGENGTNTAANPGNTALVQNVATATAGLYTIVVSSAASTMGSFTLRLDLNSSVETESSSGAGNDSIAVAQDITTSLVSVPGGISRYGVRGVSDLASLPITVESEPNNSTGTATDGSYDFESYSNNLYHMSLTGTIGGAGPDNYDYYNLGLLQVGDVITISESGSPSNRGTLTDAFVGLYRAGSSGSAIIEDDNSGPPTAVGDALIHRFVIGTTDVYYVNAQRSGSASGTYQLGIWLENTSTAPNTGGGVTGESAAANGQIASAVNVSSSWRAVNYRSTVDGTITAGDSDYYKYQFNTGDLITVVIDSTSVLDARVNLRNSAGTIIASEDGTSVGPGGDSPLFAYRITAGGTYYIETLANLNSGAYTANLYLSTTASLPAPQTGDDLYRISLAANDVVSLALDGQSVGTLNLSLLNSVGTVVDNGISGPTNFDSLIRYTAPSAGNYYIRVNGTGNVPYFAVATIGAEFDTEPNDVFGSAQTLTLAKALGGIDGTDDWYQFAATPGQVLTLTTTTPGDLAGEFANVLDPVLEMLDPNGVPLGSDDNSAGDGRNAILAKASTIGGNYRVRVSSAAATKGEYTLSLNVSNDPPAKVSSVVIDDGTAQRSLIRSLTVTFSEPVNLPGTPTNAFKLERTGPGVPTGDVTMILDSFNGTVAEFSFTSGLTEFGSLVDGLYTLTIFGNLITDGGGQPLDGDNNLGTVGGNYTLDLYRLFGESDGNRVVDSDDFAALRSLFGVMGSSPFDFDGNNNTDSGDFAEFRKRFGIMY